MLLYAIASVITISLVHAAGIYGPPANIDQTTMCVRQILSSLEELSRYYCRVRYIPTSDEFMRPGYDVARTLDTIREYSKCAYGDYDFLSGYLPEPLGKGEAEVERMLLSCLVQQAAVRFLRGTPNNVEANDAIMCPATSLKLRVFQPSKESQPFLRNYDVDGLLTYDQRHPCLEAVFSSLTRESLYGFNMKNPPPEPSFADRFKGVKQHSRRFDLNVMPEGVEWPAMFHILKIWNIGVLKGIMIEEVANDGLPTVIVYYETRESL